MPGLSENRPSVMIRDCLFVTCCDAKGKVVGDEEFIGYVHNTSSTEVSLGFDERYSNSKAALTLLPTSLLMLF